MSSYQIDISDYENDPRLFLFTSLTAGSSHIITATSRMETILKANKIPFQAIDLATDEKARRLWQRRAKERKLPGLVKDGFVLGDLDEIEEWNEFGELKENIGSVPTGNDTASNAVKTGVNIAPPISVNPTATQGTTNITQPPINKAPRPGVDESKFRALPGAAEIAARNKPTPEQEAGKSVMDENLPPKATESMTSSQNEKVESINAAKKLLKEDRSLREDHLSAPPSAMQSGTATPNPEPVAVETKAEDKVEAGSSGEETAAADAKVGDTVDASKGVEETAEEEKLTHRGSEVKEEPPEDVQKVESENTLAEAAEEKVEDKGTAAVGATDAGEGKAAEEVKEQSAREGDDATKSVGD